MYTGIGASVSRRNLDGGLACLVVVITLLVAHGRFGRRKWSFLDIAVVGVAPAILTLGDRPKLIEPLWGKPKPPRIADGAEGHVFPGNPLLMPWPQHILGPVHKGVGLGVHIQNDLLGPGARQRFFDRTLAIDDGCVTFLANYELQLRICQRILSGDTGRIVDPVEQAHQRAVEIEFRGFRFLVEFRNELRIASDFLANFGDRPNPSDLLFQVPKARTVSRNDAEVILLDHLFEEVLGFFRRCLAVRTDNEKSPQARELDLGKLGKRDHGLVGDPFGRAEHDLEAALQFRIDLRLRCVFRTVFYAFA